MEQQIDVEKIKEVINAYPKEPRYALAIMQDVQHHFNYIPRESLELLSTHIGTPVVKLYSMATFYKALKLNARGKHILKVCDGTACHIKGSTQLLDAIKRQLGIVSGETTEDSMFTLETVNCLGACAIAPVLVIDEVYYPQMNEAKLTELIRTIREGKEAVQHE